MSGHLWKNRSECLLKPLALNLVEQVFISVKSKQLGAELGRVNFALNIPGREDWTAWEEFGMFP